MFTLQCTPYMQSVECHIKFVSIVYTLLASYVQFTVEDHVLLHYICSAVLMHTVSECVLHLVCTFYMPYGGTKALSTIGWSNSPQNDTKH